MIIKCEEEQSERDEKMRKHSSFICIIMFLIAALTYTSSAQTMQEGNVTVQEQSMQLTLEDSISLMLKDNSTVKKAELGIEEAKIEVSKNSSIASDARDSGSADKEGTYYNTKLKMINYTNNYITENAKRNLEATVTSLKADVEQYYFSLQQAVQARDIYKESLYVKKELYENIKKKFDLGLVSRQEVISCELDMIKAQNKYNSAENTLTSVKMTFATKLGYSATANVSLVDGLKKKEFKDMNIEDAVKSALARRNEVKLAEFEYEKGKYDLILTASTNPENTLVYRTKKVEVDQLEKDLQNARSDIEIDVRNNLLAVQEKITEIEAGKKSVELAAEALKISKVSYDNGMEILVNLQEASTRLEETELSLSKAILDYNVAVGKFQDSILVGRTTADPVILIQ